MSSDITPEKRQIVAVRASFVCEYCLIAEEDAYYKFQVEHIISRKHGGSSELSNLALAYVFCNRHKGSDIASTIPGTNQLIRLYDPRNDRWHEHFRVNGALIEGLTNVGEVTIRILQMNHDDQVLERQVLSIRGRYPCKAALVLTMEH